ncbi:MAG: metallophosphoesterase, partial [Bythopirellula sp.]
MTLNFSGNAGETQQFTVPTLDDATVEGSETFAVNLSATNALVDANDTAIGTITDNDVQASVFETRISASSDDAEQRLVSSTVSLASADLDIVFDSSGSQQEHLVGLRFTEVNVPQGATIQNAYIQFQADEASSVATSLTVQGEGVDNALTFAAIDDNISARTTTSSSVSWTPAAWGTVGEAGPDQQTPNIASVIQEIVNRPGWSSGNALAITISGTGERVAEAFDGNAAAAPLLHVEYDSSAPVLVGAGDIAGSHDEDEATAQLLDNIAGTVFTLGDNVYPDGSAQEYNDYYDPTWGRHKDRTMPVVGNHDYDTPGATGYFDYFGAAAGDPDKGYYSYDLGDWHIVALNTECSEIGGCGANSPQGLWLQADLAANPSVCTLAYTHKPRFSSGFHGMSSSAEGFWQILYDAGADVVLSGHDHNYERFAPQNPAGVADPLGIRQFVVGTGGTSLRPFETILPNSEVRNNVAHGVLKLTLNPTSYDYEFVPIAGQAFTDSGSSSCSPRNDETQTALVAAGDIGGPHDQDEATAQLLDNIPGTVVALGNNAFWNGTAQQYNDFYDPTWGRHKDRTMPIPGNHDYDTPGATGYFDYFGAAAGDPDKGYYSYDLGDWHIIALNSKCNRIGGCDANSPEALWLQADLAANPSACTLAYVHNPRFSSGFYGSSTSTQDFWQILYDAGADVVLSGHDTDYERFAPQTPTGVADPLNGIRQFVVGTGGASLRPFETIEPNSEVRDSVTHGVIKLTLKPTSYDWEFVPIAGQTFTDSGSAGCSVPSGNRAPTVMAGSDQTITLPAGAVLDGTVWDDGLPDPPAALVNTWSKVSGPGAVTFADAGAVDTTVAFSSAGTYVLRLVTDDGEQKAVDEVTVIVNPDPTAPATILYVSVASTATLPGGVVLENEDIHAFNGVDFDVVFDGSDVGLSGANLDAFAVISADEILLSFRSAETIPGIVGTVEDSDIVKFTATQLGGTTIGVFELFLRGSDVGLAPGLEDIDAVDLHDDGRLIVSTVSSFGVSGLTGADEDLIAFTPLTPGDYSSGTWAIYFDGSDVQLGGEDVQAVALDSNGEIYLSTTNAFSVSGVAGKDEDVFGFIPSQLGADTAGAYLSTLLFDGSQFGLSANEVNAIDLPIPTGAAADAVHLTQRIESASLIAADALKYDVSGDGYVTALDALHLI